MHQKKIRIGMAVKIDENIQEQLANFDLRWTVTTFTLAQHWLLDIGFRNKTSKAKTKRSKPRATMQSIRGISHTRKPLN